MASPEFVNVLDPQGNPYHLPAGEVEAALSQGFRLASEDDQRRESIKESLSGPLGQIATAGYSAADAALLGAPSAIVKRVAPESAEYLDIARDANPVADVAGTGAGIVATLATAPGKALLGGIAKGGNAAGQAVTRGATALGAGQTTARVAGTVGRFATEGAIVAAPKATAETLFGDIDDAAETLMYGAGLGAGLGAGAELIPGMLNVGKAAAKRAADTIPAKITDKLKPEAIIDSLDSFATAQRAKQYGFSKALYNKFGHKRVKEVIDFAEEKQLHTLFEKAEDGYELLDELRKRAGKDIGGVLKEIDKSKMRFIDTTELDKRLQAVLSEAPRTELLQAEANALQKAYDSVSAVIKDRRGNYKPVPFGPLYKVKNELGDYAYTDFSTPRAGRTLVARMERVIDDIVDESLTQAEKSITGAKDMWLQAKNEYKNYAALLKPLKNKIATESGNQFVRPSDLAMGIIGANISGGVGAMVGYITNALRQTYGAEAAAYLSRQTADAIRKRDTLLSSAVKKFFGAAKQGKAAATAEATVPAYISTLRQLFQEADDTGRSDLVDRLNESIAGVTTNTEAAASRAAQLTEGLTEASPELALQMQTKMLDVVKHLEQHVPKQKGTINPYTPNLLKHTDMELAQFERRLRAALEPMSVIDDMTRGTVDAGAVDTVRELYPSLYSRLQAEILRQTAETSPQLPLEKRKQLSVIMGGALDESLKAEKTRLLQSIYQAEQQAPQRQHRARGNYSAGVETNVSRITNR